jgi:hypothetical protein
MNMDVNLVNRVLWAIGSDALKAGDIKQNSELMQIMRGYYLESFLEGLAQVEWSSAQRRRDLVPVQMPIHCNRSFSHAFELPLDCVTPISLDNNDQWRVEGNVLYTDSGIARLLYITNGRRFIDHASFSAGGADRRPVGEYKYITGGTPRRGYQYESGDNIITGGTPFRAEPSKPPEAEEDYPEYDELHLEPLFYVYVEKLLASKIAIRVLDKPTLYRAFLQEADLVRIRAIEGTSRRRASPKKAKALWVDELGLR